MALNHENIADEDWSLIGWRRLEDAHVDKVWEDETGVHMLISYPPTDDEERERRAKMEEELEAYKKLVSAEVMTEESARRMLLGEGEDG